MTKKYKVHYSGGESRYTPGTGVDYMLARVEVDGDEYELYAEIAPSDLCDEHGVPAVLQDDEGGGWNPACPDADVLSIPYLLKAIREMCAEIGLDPATLDFEGYDSPDYPQYMIPYVQPTQRIS